MGYRDREDPGQLEQGVLKMTAKKPKINLHRKPTPAKESKVPKKSKKWADSPHTDLSPKTDEQPRIEYVALRDLKKWPGNPKGHDIEGVKDSIIRFGFRGAVIFDENTKRIVAGHGRTESLQKIKDQGLPIPLYVKQVGDDWAVPVLRGTSFKSEAEARDFLLADNRYVELGGWDDAALQDMLQGVNNWTGTGFTNDDINSLAKSLEKTKSREVRFKVSDEKPAAEVEYLTCPHCKKKFPKS